MSKKTYGYYESKANCLRAIEKTVKEAVKPVKVKVLYYFVLSDYGFSNKQVDQMLKVLEEAEIVKVKDGVVKNVL